ncbi:MAG: hypothetical protein IPP72_16375 [Chitinophagaceae bacterium]|nr:hypothetical protein [Chitinophagaceae bacterium]
MGSISSDFGTAGNWAGGIVPTADADISFAASPANNCVLDQNRSLDDITNAQSSYKLVTNGKQLTIKGTLYFSNGAQINATSASSEVVFAGSVAQGYTCRCICGNTFQSMTVNNTNGLTVNDDLTISQGLSLASGAIAIGAHTLTINGEISLSAGSFTGGVSSNIIFGGSAAAVIPAVTLNNLLLTAQAAPTLAGDVSVGGTLTLSDGTLTVGAHTLTISGSSPVRTSGYLNAAHVSASVVFGNASAITLPAGLFTGGINNLTLSGAGGVTAGSDLTVNRILNLAASNPSATSLQPTIDYTNYPGTANTDYLNSIY